MVVLGLGLGLVGIAFGSGLLLLVLSNGFAGLLILELGLAFSGAPRLGSLLLRAAADDRICQDRSVPSSLREKSDKKNLPWSRLAVAVVAVTREPRAAA